LLGADDPLAQGNATGQALYTTLVAPAAGLFRPNAPVMTLTDGALSLLNFETLIVPASAAQPAHYWIDDVTLSAAPSLSMLAAAKTGHSSTGSARGKLLLLGDPVSPGEEYPELPYASLEMQRIQQHFAAQDEVVFARRQAAPAEYLASNPRQFTYIHFVSHGVASQTDPLDSAIILSRAEAPGSGPNTGPGTGPETAQSSEAGERQDSFKLYARDVMLHPIDARLVTISACYGSGTRAYAGEGLVGLSWAFLRAGAHSAIGALWEASDNSTPQLMDSLYQGLEEGQSPAAALHRAKLAMLHSSSSFRKPFYWAPFQLYTRM
jgi:CHAT domain-containing protein